MWQFRIQFGQNRKKCKNANFAILALQNDLPIKGTIVLKFGQL